MKQCKVLATYQGRSLVEISNYETKEILKYVVCSHFNNAKRFGEKWDWGHYFERWSFDSLEKCLKAAMMYLYNIDTQSEVISYSRLTELATLFKDGLLADDEEQAMIYFDETCEMTEEEKEYFGIKTDKKLKIIEIELERTQTAKIKVAIPIDESDYSAIDYAENINMYLEAEDDGDWEDVCSTEVKELTESELIRDYSEEEIWNFADYDK